MTEPRNHDALPEALQPFSRALAVHDALPDRFRPSDETPLQQCLAGSWPTLADLRALVEWGVANPSPPPNVGGETQLQAINFPYSRTFNAIAAATKIEGGNISISVRAFHEAWDAYPTTTEGSDNG